PGADRARASALTLTVRVHGRAVASSPPPGASGSCVGCSCWVVGDPVLEVGEGLPRRWLPQGSSGVGVDVDGPGTVVGQCVVAAAEQDEVVEAGGAAVCPVLDVVGVAGQRHP